jgi:hypothetical protein
MGSRPSKFKTTDVKRAIKSAELSGYKVTSFEIDGGKIKVITDANGDTNKRDELSQWMRGQHGTHSTQGT